MKVPLVFVQLHSLDRVLEVSRLFAATIGRRPGFEDMLALFKKTISKEGAGGVDSTKPWGLYVRLSEGGPIPTLVALLPVQSETGFRRLLGDLGFREMDARGDLRLYETPKVPKGFSMEVTLPPRLYLRFADGYAHICLNGYPNLLMGEELLPARPLLANLDTKVLSVTLRIDRLPAGMRRTWLAQAEQVRDLPKLLANPAFQAFADKFGKEAAGPAKVLPSNAILRQFAVTGAATIAGWAKDLVEDGRELTFDLELNADTQSLAADLYLRGQKGSRLARNLASLADVPSTVGALALQDAGFSFLAHVQFPDELRKQLPAVVEEISKQVLAEVTDPKERKEHERVFRTFGEVFAAGKLDLALAMRSQGKGRSVGVVGALAVPNGKALDRLMQDTAADVANKDLRERFVFGVAELAGVKVHRMNVQDKFGPMMRLVLGDNPHYMAFRPDAVMWTAGSDGKDNLEQALRVRPGKAPLALVAMNVRQLAQLVPLGGAEAGLAGMGLDDKHPGRIRLELAGGEALRLHAGLDLSLFLFASRRLR